MQRQKFLPIEDLIATLTEGASIRTVERYRCFDVHGG
jgi:hypothetical protein